MTVYFFTPEQMKEEIDLLSKQHGFKFFVVASNLHGTAHAPSKKVNSWRVPVAVPNVFAEGKMSLGEAMKGFYFIGVTDIDVLADDCRKVVEADLKTQAKDGK
jgi:hypothetical protein